MMHRTVVVLRLSLLPPSLDGNGSLVLRVAKCIHLTMLQLVRDVHHFNLRAHQQLHLQVPGLFDHDGACCCVPLRPHCARNVLPLL